MRSREQLWFLRAFPSRTAQKFPLKQRHQARGDGGRQTLQKEPFGTKLPRPDTSIWTWDLRCFREYICSPRAAAVVSRGNRQFYSLGVLLIKTCELKVFILSNVRGDHRQKLEGWNCSSCMAKTDSYRSQKKSLLCNPNFLLCFPKQTKFAF